jgi:uncharacterized protein with HEPN domain
MNRDLDILEFLIDSINHLESYIENVDEEGFLSNEEKRDACITRIVMLGEYSARVSNEIKHKFSDIEWQLMKGDKKLLCSCLQGN